MGYLTHEMTAKEIAKTDGVTVRAIGIPYARLRREGHPLFALPFDCNAPLSPEQVAVLRPGRSARKTSAKKTAVAAAPGPQETLSKTLFPDMWRAKAFAALAFALVVGHAGLIWYDMALLWSTPGKIGGGVAFAFIFSGMVLMSEKDGRMADVRENMLWAVGFLEALAVVVHRGAFSRNAAQAYAAGLGIEHIWALSAVVCLCSIGATVFYQKVVRL